MAVEYTFVQGNTRPFFAVVIKNDLTNAAVDLTGATVAFYFKNVKAKVAKVSAGVVTLTDAVNGKCEYRWAAADLDEPGIYDADFRVTHTDTKVQSVLIKGVVVEAKLG